MKRLTFTIILLGYLGFLIAQVPQGFTYQAVARNSAGSVLENQDLIVRISIYTSNTAVWTEEHDVVSNSQGLFYLVIGDPTVSGSGTVGTFDQIAWGEGSYELGIEIDEGNGFVDMGKTPFQSVPYALYSANAPGSENGWKKDQDSISTMSFVGIGTTNPTRTSLAVQGMINEPDTPLFEVRREDGVPVFAVFNDGVMVYMDEDSKGVKGGFAVGGYNKSKKGFTQEYLRVTSDSVRIYVPEEARAKGVKGGFAVGGYNKTGKGISQDLLYVTSDSIRMYVPDKLNDPGYVGLQGGFAVETFDPDAVGQVQGEYIMGMNKGITRFNTADSTNGFAIGRQGKGWGVTYLQVTPDNIFVGEYAGSKSFGGKANVAIGNHAGENLSSSNNVMIGNWAGTNNENGTGNVFVGPNAGRNASGNMNVFIGNDAGKDEMRDGLLFIDNTNTSSPLIFGDFNSNVLQMNGDLNVAGSLSYTGSLISASDQLFKDNITAVDGVMHDLMKVQARSYNLLDTQSEKSNGQKGEKHFGFVAQELEEIFPDLVVEVNYPNDLPGISDSEGSATNSFKGVKYMEMIPILLQGIQEQQAEIELLKQRIIELETAN